MDITLPPDFKEFLRLLNTHNVEYLLIGGYAVGYHGYPRATNDMDIWIAIHPDNAERMVTVLRVFGFETPDLSPELFLQDHSIVRMGLPPMRIEVLTTISGVEFAACYAARVTTMIDGVKVNLISLPDLKVNKQASGRYKDLDDLEHLL
jgi:predicted nucleotidyltransferase